MRSYCVYVVLTRTNTTMSRMIQLLKNDEYTHASITLDPALDYMYSFGRKHTRNPIVGVFKKEEIHKGLFGLQKVLPAAVYEIEISPAQYHRIKGILEDFESDKERYKYNYMGLVHSFQRKSHSYEDRFLCSEFVYHVLREAKVLELDKPRNLVRPQDFRTVGWNLIFEGDLKVLKRLEAKEISERPWLESINKKLSFIYGR